MKHILLNLKRFDIPKSYHGVNSLAPMTQWAETIITGTEDSLRKYAKEDVRFSMFFPEAHLMDAVRARTADSPIQVGCQGVFYDDVSEGGNFGAFTTNRPASIARALGCETTLIGHCEERRDKAHILSAGGVTNAAVVSGILNWEIQCAQRAGLQVVYCIGETAEERPRWQDVLREQLEIGLTDVNHDDIVIAYEPIWAIGPGKIPPGKEQIAETASYVKEISGNLPVVYGGGLKVENASMIASIPEVDGGLIALTRFAGEIGFYPDEYLEIISTYFGNK